MPRVRHDGEPCRRDRALEQQTWLQAGLVLVEPTELARERGREVYAPFAEATKPEFARFCDEQLTLVRDFLRAGKDFYGVQTARVERLARTPRLASE